MDLYDSDYIEVGEGRFSAGYLFERPLFRLPLFLFATALGLIALALNVYLGITAAQVTKVARAPGLWSALVMVAMLLVRRWFSTTSHVENIRARYLNERGTSDRQSSTLTTALASDFINSFRGLANFYCVAILLQFVVYVLLRTR